MDTKTHIANIVKYSWILGILIVFAYVLYQGFTIDNTKTYRNYIDDFIIRCYGLGKVRSVLKKKEGVMNNDFDFKVGDEVEVTKQGRWCGVKGTITQVDNYSGNILIKNITSILRVKNNMIKKV